MRKFYLFWAVLTAVFSAGTVTGQEKPGRTDSKVYKVSRLKSAMAIDADWEKPQWKGVKAVKIQNPIINQPAFLPETRAKMAYDSENVYVIFQVKDQFVRSITKEINGRVWEDSAVEFFFAPDARKPESYFNLEINCGGVPLLHFNSGKTRSRPEIDDIKKIEIAHSLPEVVDPEIKEPVTWTIEFRIPLSMLEKFSTITQPQRGVEWKANFYKIAEINSNPHYLTWSVIDPPHRSFHMPQFFGTLKFK